MAIENISSNTKNGMDPIVGKYKQSDIDKWNAVPWGTPAMDNLLKDPAYNEFINDNQYWEKFLSGVNLNEFFNIGNLDFSADPNWTLANPTTFGKPYGFMDWDPYDARSGNDTNYWNTNKGIVIGAPQSLIDQAKANPGQAVGFGQGSAGASTGYVWKDGALHQTQWVHDSGTGLAGALPVVFSILAPGIGTAIGEAMGLTGAAAAAAGGAVLGGGNAALTGGDILKGSALGGAGSYLSGLGSPSDITVPTEAPALPSSFDQYLAPAAPTSLADIANTGVQTFPVADQTPFQGTSMLDMANAAPQVGTPEAVQQLANNAQQAQAIQAPITPTDVAAAPAATGQSLADIANVGPSQTQPALPSSFDQYAVQNPNYSLSNPTTPPTTDMGGAQGMQQSTLPTTAPTTDMGGAQGLTAPTSANLLDMGGGQGLTTAAAGGGILGQTGVNTGATLAGNLGTSLAGINTGITQPAATSTGNFMSDTLSNLTPTQIAALGQGLLSGVGGLSTNSAIASGQAAQQAAAERSLGTLKDIYGTNMAAIAPYQQAGQQGVNQITQNMPYLTHQFDVNDLNSNLAPNYQFMLGQGQMANQRAANVGGGALSGNTLTGLNRYTQDYAGNAYQNAFNNYNTQRSNIYNTLSNIAGMGQTANAQGIGAGNTYGQNVTNLNTGLAAAQAGANVGQAQNTANTLSNIGNAATLATLLGQSNAVSNAAQDANSVIGAYFR